MNPNRKFLIGLLVLIIACGVFLLGTLMYNLVRLTTAWVTPTSIVVNTPQISTNIPVNRPATQLNSNHRVIPFQSVVHISALLRENGSLIEGWTGSGTIISQDGLILTNAHVVLPSPDAPVDVLTVALTFQQDQKPDPEYTAKVIQADPYLDIAVIKITGDLNGNPIDTTRLNLPAIQLGDSDALNLGDNLTILGYPGIGGDTITLTSGEVAGFTSEAGYSNRAYIKTSATIAGGNSGGLAANEAGELVGIPTLLGSGTESGIVDCRNLADTNHDGFIDESDTCIPMGGFINSLRPVNLALPMIAAAQRGEERVVAAIPTAASGDPGTDLLFFDDFSTTNSGWTIKNDTSGYVGYTEGSYLIAIEAPEMILSGTADKQMDNSVINVFARVTQSTGQGDFGIICRQQEDNSFYAFEIREDGYGSIWKNVSGSIVPIVGWQYIQDFSQQSPIRLTAVCVGNRLGLGVNGQLVLSAMDSDFLYGYPGLVGGTMRQGGFMITFDNFEIRKPE